MQEIKLIRELIATAQAQAAQQGAQHVYRVTVRVGAESGVAVNLLSFVFDLFKRGTPVEQAQLQIEHVPVVCWCPMCNLEFSPADALHTCPHCRWHSASVRRGQEFALVALEVRSPWN